MEYELLGLEATGPTVSLDHEQFAYAGKFVMSSTGKTVVRADGELVGAVAFSEDYSDPTAVRLRYVTVREDRRGAGIGPSVLRFTAEQLRDSYDDILIAANNPIAYEACYRAGFEFTGEETGIAEVLCSYQPESEPDRSTYQAGFDIFRDRELPSAHESIIERYGSSSPPEMVAVPDACI